MLPLLLALGLMLGLSPVGQAGFLWVHLATAQHEEPTGSGMDGLHDHGSTHRHRSGDHGHGHPGDAPHEAARPVAPDAPHEHGGRVHSHEEIPVEDPAVSAETLSRYYLSPRPSSAPLPVPGASPAPSTAPSPRQATPRIDTPPPRPTG